MEISTISKRKSPFGVNWKNIIRKKKLILENTWSCGGK